MNTYLYYFVHILFLESSCKRLSDRHMPKSLHIIALLISLIFTDSADKTEQGE
jgi:hypothetical protein